MSLCSHPIRPILISRKDESYIINLLNILMVFGGIHR